MKSFSEKTLRNNGLLGTVNGVVNPSFKDVNSREIKTSKDLLFKIYPHQWMPKKIWVYTTDKNEDPFQSEIAATKEGIVAPQSLGSQKFSVNVRWFVDGFGFLVLTADNGGQFYSINESSNSNTFNLNFELLKSRIFRNRSVRNRYEKEETKFSSEVRYLMDLSEDFFESAQKTSSEKQAKYSDKGLNYALWVGEKIELEKAQDEIERRKRTDTVYFGCETRQYIWAKSEEFTKRFAELFNFATVTHYIWDTWYEIFEPSEGVYNWGIKDNIINWLLENNITIQGRPLFWFHPAVTPDWLKNKNFEQLKQYVVKHTKDLVGHYGDKIQQWAVVNEYHDWANIHKHTPEQITEITRLACDTVKELNPNATRIINNCCPFAEYAALGRWNSKQVASRQLRSPRKFISDLIDAGVDFDVLGIQIYFPHRDLSDIMRMIEKLQTFGKTMYITEIGATSGPTKKSILNSELDFSEEPYQWHRHWDEELQADWLEQVYTLYYSRPNIKAINWYDFADFRTFIINGGLVTESCRPKPSFHRLKILLDSWGRLPKG